MSNPAYTPIDCEFHDQLEAHATTRRRVAIVHGSEAGGDAVAEGVIADLWTAPSKEEFLRLDDGTVIRLDRIREVHPAASAA